MFGTTTGLNRLRELKLTALLNFNYALNNTAQKGLGNF